MGCIQLRRRLRRSLYPSINNKRNCPKRRTIAMGKKKSRPHKASGSALRSRLVEAMECRQLLSASFGHALFPAFSRSTPAPATMVSQNPAPSASDWHDGHGGFSDDAAASTPVIGSAQYAFDHRFDNLSNGGAGEYASDFGSTFAPMHHDLLRASTDGYFGSSSASPIIISNTVFLSLSNVPGDANVIVYQNSGNPLSGPSAIYERATYIIAYGTVMPADPMEMHGPHYD